MTTNNLPAPLTSVAAPERSLREPWPVRQVGVSEPEGDFAGRRALSAVLRFKWLILLVPLLGTAAGVGATRVLKPDYSAQATVWIDVAERRGPDRGPIRPGQLLDPQAWVDLLKSYVVLDQVVRDRRLFLEPKSPEDTAALAPLRLADPYPARAHRLTVGGAGRISTLATPDGIALARGAVGDSVGARVGVVVAPAPGAL